MHHRPWALIAIGVALLGAGEIRTAAAQEQEAAKLCSRAEVKGTVARFVAAFNAGHVRQLDRAFAAKPYFRWYSTDTPGQRFSPRAGNRSSLVSYFARRHALGEHLTLRSLRVNGNTTASGHGWKTYGNFEFTLVRAADDLPPTDYGGKGALHCYRDRKDELIVWSMGRMGLAAPPSP